MFIYRPIGTQFITDDLRAWAKDMVKDHFGPAFMKVLRRDTRIPTHKDHSVFLTSLSYRQHFQYPVPNLFAQHVGRIDKEKKVSDETEDN